MAALGAIPSFCRTYKEVMEEGVLHQDLVSQWCQLFYYLQYPHYRQCSDVLYMKMLTGLELHNCP